MIRFASGELYTIYFGDRVSSKRFPPEGTELHVRTVGLPTVVAFDGNTLNLKFSEEVHSNGWWAIDQDGRECKVLITNSIGELV